MAIEKPMTPSSLDVEGSEDVKIEIVNPDAISIGDEESGMVIDFTGEMAEELVGPEHDANLAEFIDESDLQGLAAFGWFIFQESLL